MTLVMTWLFSWRSADCLLLSTVHEENAVLGTYDEKLLHFGKEKFISLYDPR